MVDIIRLGIDPASSTGYSIMRGREEIDGGVWEVGSPGWTKSPEAASKAASTLGTLVLTAVLDFGVEEVVCENPTSRSNGISKAYGCMLNSVSYACEMAMHTRATFVLPSKWKKVVLGKGNAGKPEILAFATEVLGRAPVNQDHADAVCLAMYEALT